MPRSVCCRQAEGPAGGKDYPVPPMMYLLSLSIIAYSRLLHLRNSQAGRSLKSLCPHSSWQCLLCQLVRLTDRLLTRDIYQVGTFTQSHSCGQSVLGVNCKVVHPCCVVLVAPFHPWKAGSFPGAQAAECGPFPVASALHFSLFLWNFILKFWGKW